MPRCDLLLLGEDVHRNGRGTMDVQGVVGGIQLEPGTSFPVSTFQLFALASLRFTDDEPREWQLAYQWWHGHRLLRSVVQTLDRGVDRRQMHAVRWPEPLPLVGAAPHEMRLLCRQHDAQLGLDQGWGDPLAVYAVDVVLREAASDAV